jgi:undecaprenyl-phosphate 4-deoxy-4-formamido-L-arabinose transferase
MEKISIVIPVYNSANSLEALNKEINTYFRDKDFYIEKIFVDDASKDQSFEILKALQRTAGRNEHIKILKLKHNVGQQNALFCGIGYGTGDYFVTMDDDLQHDIAYVEDMIQRLKSGADLVYGIHDMGPMNTRSLGSKLTGYFFRHAFPVLAGKRVSSFRAFKGQHALAIRNCDYRFIYLSALLLKEVERVDNIQIIKRDRPYGQSGYTLKKLVRLFLRLNYYYGPWIPEILKPKGEPYEEIDDTWCRQLSAECHT